MHNTHHNNCLCARPRPPRSEGWVQVLRRHHAVLARVMLCVIACLSLLSAARVRADQSPNSRPVVPVPATDATATDGGPQDRVPVVDGSHARLTHPIVERWVRAGATDDRNRPLQVKGVSAVRVDLRWAGEPAGVHTGMGEAESAGADKPVDLIALARKATDQAIEMMFQRYTQRMIAAGRQPTYSKTQLGQHMLVELQIGLALEPIAMKPRESEFAIYEKWRYGYHGLKMVNPVGRESDEAAWLWPATAITTNLDCRRHLRQLMSQLDVDVADPNTATRTIMAIGQPRGVKLYRFEVLHAVRPASSLPVELLVRGNKTIPLRAINGPTIEMLAHRMSRHLQRRQASDGKMTGTIEPSRVGGPDAADDAELALASYALTRRAANLAKANPHGERTLRSRSAATKALQHLSTAYSKEPQSLDPSTKALMLLCLTEAVEIPQYIVSTDKLVPDLRKLHQKQGYFNTPGLAKEGQMLSRQTQALLFCALANYYVQTRDKSVLPVVDASRDYLWKHVWANEFAARQSLMPWLAIGELRLQQIERDPPEERAIANLKARQELIQFCQALARIQSEPERGGPGDLAGGIPFVRPMPTGLPELPDWHTAHSLAAMSVIWRHGNVASQDERAKLLLSCTKAARFIGQLMFDQPSLFYVAIGSDAMGGVRMSLWDNRLPVATTAMGLLAMTEFQINYQVLQAEALQKRSTGDPDTGSDQSTAEPGVNTSP